MTSPQTPGKSLSGNIFYFFWQQMMAINQDDHAENEWHQYCVAKDQARREYEVLYGKESGRHFLLMIMCVIGLPAILISLGLPAFLSILGAPAAFFIYSVSEKKSAELRDAEINSQNFGSFEQWKNKTSSAQSVQENECPDIHQIIQSTTLKNSTEKLTLDVYNNSTLHTPVEMAIQEDQEPSRLFVPRIEASDFDFKISLAANLLKEVYRNIEDGKPLRPREKLKILISETAKLKVTEELYLDVIFELIKYIDEIKLLFDPFTDQPVWDRLQLASDLLLEISNSNFKTTNTVADAQALEEIKKPKLTAIKIKPPKAGQILAPESMPIEKAESNNFKKKQPISTSKCPACKMSFTSEELTEYHAIGIRCPHCRQLMSNK